MWDNMKIGVMNIACKSGKRISIVIILPFMSWTPK